MFRSMSLAEFNVEGHKAFFYLDNQIPVTCVQEILNKLMHFCVERLQEAEAEEKQRIQDEQAIAPVVLEAEPAPIAE